MTRLPLGTVTFLLTEVADATALWERDAEAMAGAVGRLDDLVARVLPMHGGHKVKPRGEGDSQFLVFHTPGDGIDCAVHLARLLAEEQWPEVTPIRLRMALHTGPAEWRDGDYYGTTVNRCARLRSIAHPGQIVVSAATAAHAASRTDPIAVVPLGIHWLRDLARPEHVHEIRHPDLPSGFPPLTSAPPPAHRLPLPPTPFIGRDRELTMLDEMVSVGRSVTITGVPGVGKSRLALELAAVELDAERCDFDIVNGMDGSDGSDGATDAIATRLAELADEIGPGTLVVVHDVDRAITATARLVARLLERRPDVAVVAAARSPLGVPGEVVFPLVGLALPPEDADRGEAFASPAVQLFVARAIAARASLRLGDEEVSATVRLCHALEGNPLAIELAAARAAVLNPSQILARLDRPGLLSDGRRAGPRHHASLADAVRWTADLLDAGDRAALERLAGGDQTALAGFEGGTVDRLLSRSLVVRHDDAITVPSVVRVGLAGAVAARQ